MITIKILNRKGHETKELTLEEAQELIDVERGRYFVINEESGEVLKEINLENGQKLAMIPKVCGGFSC